MNILSISHIYNEGLYLEDSYNYLKDNGVNQFLYVDNMSTDNSNEFLKDKKDCIVHRFNTGGSFHLLDLQKEMFKHVHEIKPDWVIYTDPDLFYSYEGTIAEEIHKAEYYGCNQISTMCWGALNTGEQFKLPLRKHFFYGVHWKPITRLSKYDVTLYPEGDNLFCSDPVLYQSTGIVINYGGCKEAIDQDEKLERIIKARKQGQRSGIGTHYSKYKAKGYLWNKAELQDLRTVKLIKKLID